LLLIAKSQQSAVGVGAAYQPLILRGEQSGLQMHTDDGKRFIVRADEKLTAFLELESAHSRLQKDQNEEIESKRGPIATVYRGHG
jgi:hypothetical protein